MSWDMTNSAKSLSENCKGPKFFLLQTGSFFSAFELGFVRTKCLLLNTIFRYAQIPFNTGITVFTVRNNGRRVTRRRIRTHEAGI